MLRRLSVSRLGHEASPLVVVGLEQPWPLAKAEQSHDLLNVQCVLEPEVGVDNELLRRLIVDDAPAGEVLVLVEGDLGWQADPAQSRRSEDPPALPNLVVPLGNG